MSSIAKKILVAPLAAPQVPISSTVITVAKEHKISPIKQFIEATMLFFGSSKLASNEYYDAQIYRSDLSGKQKKEFVGETANLKLNSRLSPKSVARISDFLRDKVLYPALLHQLGFDAPKAQAVFSQLRGFGDLKTLRSIADIENFLLNDANYPVFAKPIQGSSSVGSARLHEADAKTATVTLGNGITFDIKALATEIFNDHPRGFVFQDAIKQHPDVTAVIGSALGTLRVVTIIENNIPRVLYTVWKIPSPDAMSDNFWQAGSMLGNVDKATGQLRQVRRGTGLNTEILEKHPVSGAVLPGFQIPFWDDLSKIAVNAHKLSLENGILGWDIGISEDGPVIIECNTNPFHTLYQMATGEGVMNERFSSAFEHVFKRNDAIIAHMKMQERLKKRMGRRRRVRNLQK